MAERIPQYCRQKSANQKDRAFVVIDGERIYLGPWDSDASKEEYNRLIAEWLAGGRRVAPTLRAVTQTTVAVVMDAFWQWAKARYRKPDGTATPGLEHIRQALKLFLPLFASLPAAEFSPKKLKTFRASLVQKGAHARASINAHVKVIKRMFKWAVGEELVPADVWKSLEAVEGLRRGESEAREGGKVDPVPQHLIDAVRPRVSRQVRALIDLQLLTGARAGELVDLRPCDLDTSDPSVWVAHRAEHKTAHHGKRRELYFNAEARAIIEQFITDRPTTAPLFSPKEAEAERQASRHAMRKTPLSCGNKPGDNVAENPERSPGDHYTVASYRRAIAYACRKAFPVPPELRDDAVARVKWISDHQWHPHQLRHNAGTELRKRHGLEMARIILGHSSASITEVYAEADRAKAIAAIQDHSIQRVG